MQLESVASKLVLGHFKPQKPRARNSTMITKMNLRKQLRDPTLLHRVPNLDHKDYHTCHDKSVDSNEKKTEKDL